MTKIFTLRIPGKWEFGLFRDGRFRVLGAEIRTRGYKRIPIRAAYANFTPPSGHTWDFDTDGGRWKVRAGTYRCYVLHNGEPFLQVHELLPSPLGGSIIVAAWRRGGAKKP